MSGKDLALHTPDGRYIMVRGRPRRGANSGLAEEVRACFVAELMDARRAVGAALREGDPDAERAARARVHTAKVALGERGPVLWTDGAPDLNRSMAVDTPYADWFRAAAEPVPL